MTSASSAMCSSSSKSCCTTQAASLLLGCSILMTWLCCCHSLMLHAWLLQGGRGRGRAGRGPHHAQGSQGPSNHHTSVHAEGKTAQLSHSIQQIIMVLLVWQFMLPLPAPLLQRQDMCQDRHNLLICCCAVQAPAEQHPNSRQKRVKCKLGHASCHPLSAKTYQYRRCSTPNEPLCMYT